MGRLFCIGWLLLFIAGCVHSERIAFYRPVGGGKIQKDHRRVPQAIKYQFGHGSELVLRTGRTRDKTEIGFWLRLNDQASFRADAVQISCENGDVVMLKPGSWTEWRIKDGVGYLRELDWNVQLSGRDYDSRKQDPPRGDVSTGEYWSSIELSTCIDSSFSVQIPLVQLSDGVQNFGIVDLHPEEKRFTWSVPLQ